MRVIGGRVEAAALIGFSVVTMADSFFGVRKRCGLVVSATLSLV